MSIERSTYRYRVGRRIRVQRYDTRILSSVPERFATVPPGTPTGSEKRRQNSRTVVRKLSTVRQTLESG